MHAMLSINLSVQFCSSQLLYSKWLEHFHVDKNNEPPPVITIFTGGMNVPFPVMGGSFFLVFTTLSYKHYSLLN